MIRKQAAVRRRKRGFAAQNTPPILFSVLPKRERAVHGVREKALRDELTQVCQLTQNVGTTGTDCLLNLEVTYRLR